MSTTDTRTDHRTAEWIAEFERGKASAASLWPGRSNEAEERNAQRRKLFAHAADVKAVEGPWPSDPFNHGRKVGVHDLIEEFML